MKITKIRTLTVAAPPNRNWVFVKVETDQPGLYGWGDALVHEHPDTDRHSGWQMAHRASKRPDWRSR